MGRTHAGNCVILLVQDLQTRVINNAATDELVRDPTLDPSPDYQPTGAPKDPAAKPEMNNTRFLRHHSCSEDSVLVQDMSNTCL
jgi:hypothetical protein